MEVVNVRCGKCAQLYVFSAEFSGRRVGCKKCGAPIIIPSLEGRNSPVAATAPQAPSRVPPSRKETHEKLLRARGAARLSGDVKIEIVGDPRPAARDGKEDLHGMLASRPSRLAAFVIDKLIVLPLEMVGLYFLGALDFIGTKSDMPASFFLVDSLVVMACFLIINGYFIYTRSQTVGKLICGIVVVDRDGRRASGNRYVFLRLAPMWLVSMISLVGRWIFLADGMQTFTRHWWPVVGTIIIVGPLVILADALLVFRTYRNCLHDDIAGTLVVRKECLKQIAAA